MLGLSFSKLLLLVLVVVVAWRGLRLMNRIQKHLDERQRTPSAPPRTDPRATDLVECPRCGLFVPNGTICRSVEECRFRRAS